MGSIDGVSSSSSLISMWVDSEDSRRAASLLLGEVGRESGSS